MLEDAVKALAQGRNFAALATLLPSGRPQTHIMWVDADDEYILLNTEIHRRKFKNVERDPRVTVMVFENGNPYHFVEVRGTVVDTVRGPEARAHIDYLSQKYDGQPFPDQIKSERVILRIVPTRQIVH